MGSMKITKAIVFWLLMAAAVVGLWWGIRQETWHRTPLGYWHCCFRFSGAGAVEALYGEAREP